MSVRQNQPFPVQVRANVAMARTLQVATWAALVLGLLGALVPGRPGQLLGWACVTVVIAAPLVRVAWLVGRWLDRRDHPFALLALALLLIVVAGGVVALIQAP